MKRKLRKAAFYISVALVTLVFLIPVTLVREVLFPFGRGPRGYSGGGDGLPMGIIVVFVCLAMANRFVSFLFQAGGLSEERWSVLSHRPPRGLA
jgi:hypothetical protein